MSPLEGRVARDLASRGITATVVHGGLIDTDMNPADGPGADLLRPVTAAGRYGRPMTSPRPSPTWPARADVM